MELGQVWRYLKLLARRKPLQVEMILRVKALGRQKAFSELIALAMPG